MEHRWIYVEVEVSPIVWEKEGKWGKVFLTYICITYAHSYAKTQVESGTFGIWHYRMWALYLNMQLHQVWQSKHDRASLLASSQPFPNSERHRRYKRHIHSYIHPLASLKYGLGDPWGLVELCVVLLGDAFPIFFFSQTHFWMLLAYNQNKHSTDTGDNNSGADLKIKPGREMRRL